MIEIKVRLFAILKEMAAGEEFPLALSREASCQEAIFRLKTIFGFPDSLLEHCLVAVNGTYADRRERLHEGDELALLPPASGG